MLDKSAIVKVVDFLAPQDFYKQIRQIIVKEMLKLLLRNEPVDLLSVSARLKEKNQLDEIGGSRFLAEFLNSVPTAVKVRHHGERVQNKHGLRRLIEVWARMADLG